LRRLSSKVLVIGGGPAGASTARYLSESGIETLLIEKDLSYSKPCGGGLPSTAFDELDLPKETIKKRVKEIRVVSIRGKEVVFPLTGGHISIVKRGEFDNSLRGYAQRAGAEILEARFSSFKETKDRVLSEVYIKGEPCIIESDFAVCADGAGSRGLYSLISKSHEAVYTLSTTSNELQSNTCEFWFNKNTMGFYSWVFPSPEGLSIGVGGREPSELKRQLEIFLKKRGISSYGRLRGYKIPIWQGGIFNLGRVLFVGDSATQVMPFTFEGIYYAMKSGTFAAEAIREGKIENYKRLWQSRFGLRFSLMKKLWEVTKKSESFIERFVLLHNLEFIQRASSRLWLDKSATKKNIYLKLIARLR